MASVHLTCPRCHLTIRQRVEYLVIKHCPRCVARRRVLVELSESSVPPRESPAKDMFGRPLGGAG